MTIVNFTSATETRSGRSVDDAWAVSLAFLSHSAARMPIEQQAGYRTGQA